MGAKLLFRHLQSNTSPQHSDDAGSPHHHPNNMLGVAGRGQGGVQAPQQHGDGGGTAAG